jgi:hypothetical protein
MATTAAEMFQSNPDNSRYRDSKNFQETLAANKNSRFSAAC